MIGLGPLARHNVEIHTDCRKYADDHGEKAILSTRHLGGESSRRIHRERNSSRTIEVGPEANWKFPVRSMHKIIDIPHAVG